MAVTKVVSEIPGTVVRIEAPAGTRVAEDDPIVFVESMKMEIPIPAPRAGTVTEVLVGEGDAVQEGTQIASLEY